MKLAINGALTIGTDDGANIEMRKAITDKWWPFAFGASAPEIQQMKDWRSYNPKEIYQSNGKLKQALDMFRDHIFAKNDSERQAFTNQYYRLLEVDPYFCLYDFESYYEVQKKVEHLYCQPELWAEYALNNIANMGDFSSDRSVENYCEQIWQIQSTPINQEFLDAIRCNYKEIDACRIYN